MLKKVKTDFELFVIDRVRDRRRVLNMSQEDVAMFLDTDRSFVGQVESASNPAKYNLNHLNILAKELGCSPKDFMPEAPLGI